MQKYFFIHNPIFHFHSLCLTLAWIFLVMTVTYPSFADDLEETNQLYKQLIQLHKQGKYTEAAQIGERALVIQERLLGPEHPDTVTSLNNLAVLYKRMNDYVRAEPLYKRALEIREKILESEHPDIAISLNNLAMLYRAIGDYAKAGSFHKRSLDIYEKAFGSDHPDTAILLNNLAFLYSSQDRNQEAIILFQRGLAIEDKNIKNVFTIASEKQKLGFVKNMSSGFKAALSLIHQKFSKNQEALMMGLNIVLSRKGVVFDAQARQLEGIARVLDPEARELWKKLSLNRSNLAKLHQGKPEKMSYDTYRSRIEKFQSDIEDMESQLASAEKLYTLIWEPISSSIGEAGRVVVSPDGELNLIPFGALRCKNGRDGKDKFLIEDKIISYVTSGRDLLRTGGGIEPELDLFLAADPGFEITTKELWERLSSNLEKLLKDKPEKMSPKIYSSRLAMLKSEIERLKSQLVSTGGLNREELEKTESMKGKVAVNAETSKISTIKRGLFRSAGFTMKFDQLDGTVVEAETIPGLLPGEDKCIVKGVEATESSVLSVKRPKTMHLATHGFFLKDQQDLCIDEKGFMSDRAPTLPKGYENPLVRSGLAFTGANHAKECDTSLDGLLTALEISGMDLHGTELVTLSACETAVGEVKAGEGVFGLRRAFALSGARNLLMSLWPVVDDITAEQMTTFYRSYGKGENPAKALRNAQLETIAKLREEYDGYAPPSLWAPFILQGPLTNEHDIENFQ